MATFIGNIGTQRIDRHIMHYDPTADLNTFFGGSTPGGSGLVAPAPQPAAPVTPRPGPFISNVQPAQQSFVLPQQVGASQQPIWTSAAGGQVFAAPGAGPQAISFPQPPTPYLDMAGANFSPAVGAATRPAASAPEEVAPAAVVAQAAEGVSDAAGTSPILDAVLKKDTAPEAFRFMKLDPAAAASSVDLGAAGAAEKMDEAPAAERTLGASLDAAAAEKPAPLTAETYGRAKEARSHFLKESKPDPIKVSELEIELMRLPDGEAKAAKQAELAEMKAGNPAMAERELNTWVATVDSFGAALRRAGLEGFDAAAEDLGLGAVEANIRNMTGIHPEADIDAVVEAISTGLATARKGADNFNSAELRAAIAPLADAKTSIATANANAIVARPALAQEISQGSPLSQHTSPSAARNSELQTQLASRYDAVVAEMDKYGVPVNNPVRMQMEANAKQHKAYATSAAERQPYVLDRTKLVGATLDALAAKHPGMDRAVLQDAALKDPGLLGIVDSHNAKVGDRNLTTDEVKESFNLVSSMAASTIEGLGRQSVRSGFTRDRDALGRVTMNWGNIMQSGGLALALYAPFEARYQSRRAEKRFDAQWEKEKEWQREQMALANGYQLEQIGAMGEAESAQKGTPSGTQVARF